ncbi:hypothetical protein [Candidatus Nitrotoga sp. M5]|uniref:hypothetical protein n=1 Tax=Candidatus Nitrotoga sp. M5 TaxID=2890409 RepID=UPI001EF2123A|nr:hypothetical protein [Candidatus Nitrotoga sp. M5]
MLERTKEVTRHEKYTCVEYAIFVEGMANLVDAHQQHNWLMKAATRKVCQATI